MSQIGNFPGKLLPRMNSSASSPENVGAPLLAQVDPPNSSRALLLPALAVAVCLAIAGMLFAHYGRSKPDASGTALQVVVYPVQVDPEAAQPSDLGMPGTGDPGNELIVLVEARVTNLSQKPLTIFDIVADVSLPDTREQSSAALPEDIDRLMQRFPNLASLRRQPLARHQVIPPGQSVEGLVVFNFPWTKQDWDQRRKSQMTVSFVDGRSAIFSFQ